MVLKIECINHNLYLDFEKDLLTSSAEKAEKQMCIYNGLLKSDGHIFVKDDEYNCILYSSNILGMYVISEQAFHDDKYRKG